MTKAKRKSKTSDGCQMSDIGMDVMESGFTLAATNNLQQGQEELTVVQPKVPGPGEPQIDSFAVTNDDGHVNDKVKLNIQEMESSKENVEETWTNGIGTIENIGSVILTFTSFKNRFVNGEAVFIRLSNEYPFDHGVLDDNNCENCITETSSGSEPGPGRRENNRKKITTKRRKVKSEQRRKTKKRSRARTGSGSLISTKRQRTDYMQVEQTGNESLRGAIEKRQGHTEKELINNVSAVKSFVKKEVQAQSLKSWMAQRREAAVARRKEKTAKKP